MPPKSRNDAVTQLLDFRTWLRFAKPDGDAIDAALSKLIAALSENLAQKDAARFRWWLGLWCADSDRAMDVLNDVVSKPSTPEEVRAAIDIAIQEGIDESANR